MTKKLICSITRPPSSYSIEINPGILSDIESLEQQLNPYGSRFAFIADEKVAYLFGNDLCLSLSKYGMKANLFSFPAGEENKTRQTKEFLENRLLEHRFGRDSCIVALGGGVTTDIAGFIAATYCRGIPLVMIPTTLLGMVDASIGGKTGVNVPAGKNIIGSIYQPKKVLIDTETLKSLPLKELRNGVVEMVKHSLIADPAYFDELDKNYENLLALDPESIQKAIYESCIIKKTIVEQDERESGKRHLLNFGHTIAHALETLTHYAIPHGEAVAIGILVEGHISVQLGHLDIYSLEQIRKVLKQYGLPLKLSFPVSEEAIFNTMGMDKKSQKGIPHFTVLKKIGSPLPFDNTFCTSVDKAIISQALRNVIGSDLLRTPSQDL